MTALAPTASADNPLGAATGGGIADPAGDVEIAADQVLAQAEIDSIDVTRLRWKVVKIAFDGLQRSTRYPGGMALRFARVLRYRDDKSVEEADTIESVRALVGPV